MPAPDPVAERANPRLAQGLLWAGVGLAPLAALFLLFGGGTGTLRFAVFLVLVSIALIGASVTLRGGSGASRVDLEEAMVEEMVRLRAEVRSEIANATRVGQAASQQRLQALSAAVDGLQAQFAAVQNAVPDPAPVAIAAPPGRAAIAAAAVVPPVVEQEGRVATGYARASVAPPAPAERDEPTAYGSAQDDTYGGDQGGYTPRRAQADDGGYTGQRYAEADDGNAYGYGARSGDDRYGSDYGRGDHGRGDDYERSGYDRDDRDRDERRARRDRDDEYDQYDRGRGYDQEERREDTGRARASASASVSRAGGRAQAGRGSVPGQLAGGIVRHTETVHVTTRSTIVDPRGDSGSLYGAGEYNGSRGDDYGRDTADRGRRARGSFDPGARDFDPGYRDFRGGGHGTDEGGYRGDDRGGYDSDDRGGYGNDDRGGYGYGGYGNDDRAEREESTEDVGRRAARPGRPSWGEQANPYDRPALESSSSEPSWSQIRQAGDRYAAVRQDDRGQELRVGERRASVRSDDSGTEMRVEDRWESVRREDRAANPYDRDRRGPQTGQMRRVIDQGPSTGQIRRVGEDPQPWRTQQRGGRREEPWRVGPDDGLPGPEEQPRGRYDDGRYDGGRYDDGRRADRGGYDYRQDDRGRSPQRFDSSSLYGEASQFTGEQRAISAIEWDRDDYRR
ncbi:hypothetical protein [Catenuloplanes atrovinosus]|uniref:Uncharacterized protein n=1 Tax=Catenuloplanes atrovinosus TaxID=137266 RepID=A0AAE3YWY3_9ACTN|nr:hypothetical protein [Catenuloplanes atrovinosus]MDR7280307.1 hypothetical protein [Catenuloplanes atrovinosus]